MAGKKNPEFAVRLATGVSARERAEFERIARERRVTVAAVVRWAVEQFLEREGQGRADESA